jgi:RNA-directed DNA polymerase
MTAETHRGDEAHGGKAGRYPADACVSAEADTASRVRTKAEAGGRMEAVVERGNLMLAYQRVVENEGAAGVDGLTVSELKGHLKQPWPQIRARLLAGGYVPLPVRRVDIAKPDGGLRTLGIPAVVDHESESRRHAARRAALAAALQHRVD